MIQIPVVVLYMQLCRILISEIGMDKVIKQVIFVNSVVKTIVMKAMKLPVNNIYPI